MNEKLPYLELTGEQKHVFSFALPFLSHHSISLVSFLVYMLWYSRWKYKCNIIFVLCKSGGVDEYSGVAVSLSLQK